MASQFVYSVQSFLKWKGINPGPLEGVIGDQTVAAWNRFLDLEEEKAKPAARPLAADGTDLARFSRFLLHSILPSECAYVKGSKERIPEDVTWEDVPGDSGGVTKWGVDQSSHRGVDIKNLSLADAEAIYYKEWEEHKCNLLPTPIAEVVFDTLTTGGHPIVWLQEVLGVTADGVLRPNTVGEAAKSDPLKTANSFLVKRDQYFTSLADSVSHDRKFLAGWLNRDKNLKAYIATLV
jgi:Glycosyl hydrolase 108/Predicted Peptidoglycan domain